MIQHLTDFYRMLWEQRCSVVLMLTGLVENRSSKCDKYYPDLNDNIQAEEFTLHCESEERGKDLVLRKLKLSLEGTEQTLVFTQVHFASWADQSAPALEPFFELCDLTDDLNSTHGPIVVHCSAGLGRTGTFVAIHATLQKIKHDLKSGIKNPVINLPKTIYLIRENRPGSVQNPAQYEFCYEAILAGYTQLTNPKKPKTSLKTND
jgi:protein tyrosine phosphatase